MKKLVTLTLSLFLALGALAQGEIVSKYFDRFADNEEFVKASISAKMFSLFTELEAGSDDEKEFLEAVSKLKGMKVLYGDSVSQPKKLYNEGIADVKKAGFEELMTVLDAEENFHFAIKEKGGIISELILVSGGKKGFSVLSIYGEIDLKNISKIARSMQIDGLKNLEKIDERNDKND
ncbi:MAG: DUF4252 domain-containing protein [Cytophagales bacterium]|nr:DUF4252 domain-containing protein [Cytophagales bacterium]